MCRILGLELEIPTKKKKNTKKKNKKKKKKKKKKKSYTPLRLRTGGKNSSAGKAGNTTPHSGKDEQALSLRRTVRKKNGDTGKNGPR